jgi:hypothetical protein
LSGSSQQRPPDTAAARQLESALQALQRERERQEAVWGGATAPTPTKKSGTN